MDLQNEITELEKELLIIITSHVEKQEMTKEEAQKLAQDFLKILPVNDQKDLLVKLKILSGSHNEIKPLYYSEKNKILELNKDQILEHVSQLIKNGEIEKATEIIKEATKE